MSRNIPPRSADADKRHASSHLQTSCQSTCARRESHPNEQAHDPRVDARMSCPNRLNRRFADGVRIKRDCSAQPIQFNPDGTIPEVQMTSQGAGAPLGAFSRIEAEVACQLTRNVRIEAFDVDKEHLTEIHKDDAAAYKYIDFGKSPATFTAEVAGQAAGGAIEIYFDSPAGKRIGVCAIPANTNPKAWETYTCDVTGATGVHAIYLKFTGGDGSLFNLDWFTFNLK